MKLTEIAIKRPAFMAMIFLALAVFGMYSYSKMGEDLLPKMNWPMAFISTAYPGAGPEEIETQVSQPIEDALSSLNGVKSIRTYSAENFSFAMVEFEMNVDIDVALNDIEREMNQVKAELPDDVKTPTISKADVGSFAILRIATLSRMDNQSFYQFVKDKVKPKLEQVDGVSSVEIVGGKQREIRVEVDNEKLKHFNLSLGQVTDALTLQNLDYPTGTIEQKDRKFTVRVAGKFHAVDDIQNLILASTPNGIVHVRDVATVLDTSKEDFTYGRLNGTSSIGILIQKASDANAVKTSDAVKKALKTLESQYKQNGLQFIIAQDITTFTKESVKSVQVDMLFAILMVALVLFIFLHNIKNALIVLFSIPISLVTTFIMMKLLGFTLNLISLMAMTLVIGILVDDSIVVLENIHRMLQRGENKVNAAIKGRSEIGLAAIAITLVDVVTFLPIAMLSGMVGKIFREFGLTVVTATLVSLFVSFTLTPLLASRWSSVVEYTKDNFITRFVKWFDRIELRVINGYKSLLVAALAHRWRVILICVGSLIMSFFLIGMGLIGTEFMPSTDRGEFAVNLELPKGASIAENDVITKKVEAIVANTKEVDTYYTVVGRKEQPWGGQNQPDISQIQVKLIPMNKRKSTDDVISDLRNNIAKVPGVKVSFAMIGLFGAAEDQSLMLEIKGYDLNSLIKASQMVKAAAERVPGTRDVTSSWEDGKAEVQVRINRERCAQYQLTVGEVGAVLHNALEGEVPSKFSETGTEYDIRVLLDKEYRKDPENVKRILITNRAGESIQLSQVADISYGIGPNLISRKDRSRVISISFNATVPSGQIRKSLEAELAKMTLPSDVNVFFSGDFEQSSDMFSDMLLAIAFAILFIYMIMVSLFESYIYPFIIMFSIPVALVGALFGLAITHETLNIFSMIGILMSMGLVSKNAILLVDYTNTLRKRGMGMMEALLEAGPTRLRPIVMTTMTMIFGMLPIALSAGSGADMRKGLAIVVIGALISSTMLTLVLVPVVYVIVEKIRTYFGWNKKDVATMETTTE